MSFNLESLKDSLLQFEVMQEKENKIWIEELELPEWFDTRMHFVYLPNHMQDKFKESSLPYFIRFSENTPFDQMYVVERDLWTNHWDGKLK